MCCPQVPSAFTRCVGHDMILDSCIHVLWEQSCHSMVSGRWFCIELVAGRLLLFMDLVFGALDLLLWSWARGPSLMLVGTSVLILDLDNWASDLSLLKSLHKLFQSWHDSGGSRTHVDGTSFRWRGLKMSILDGMGCLQSTSSIICGLWIWGIGLVIWKLGLRPSFFLNETSFSSLDLNDGALDLWVRGPLLNCVGYETILGFDVRTWGNSLTIAWTNPG